MDDNRPVLRVVGADVLQIEVLGLHVVELNRGALPLATNSVHHVEVDLRPVERPVTLI